MLKKFGTYFNFTNDKIRLTPRGLPKIDGVLGIVLACIYVLMLFGINFIRSIAINPANTMVLLYLLVPLMVTGICTLITLHMRSKSAKVFMLLLGLSLLITEVILAVYTHTIMLPIVSILLIAYTLTSKRLIFTCTAPYGHLGKAFQYVCVFIIAINLGLFVFNDAQAAKKQTLDQVLENYVVMNEGKIVVLDQAEITLEALISKDDTFQEVTSEQATALLKAYHFKHRPMLALNNKNLGKQIHGSLKFEGYHPWIVIYERNAVEIQGLIYKVEPIDENQLPFYEALNVIMQAKP